MRFPLATLVATSRAHNDAGFRRLARGNAPGGARVLQPPTMETPMAAKLAVLAAVALAMAPFAAAAQMSADTTGYQEADHDMKVQPFDLSVDDVEDMDLKTPDGDDIGEVEEVLLDASGWPVALVVEVGGFLDVGDREVVLGLDEVDLKDDDFVTTVDKATLEGLPVWED
jgi:hypothetical protein